MDVVVADMEQCVSCSAESGVGMEPLCHCFLAPTFHHLAHFPTESLLFHTFLEYLHEICYRKSKEDKCVNPVSRAQNSKTSSQPSPTWPGV